MMNHKWPQHLPKGGANPMKGAKGVGALSICNLVNCNLYTEMSVSSCFTLEPHCYMQSSYSNTTVKLIIGIGGAITRGWA